MEAYDISNISGFESVGSMIVYENGRPKRTDYRKFKIKWVQGADDYVKPCGSPDEAFPKGKGEFSGLYSAPRSYPLWTGKKGRSALRKRFLRKKVSSSCMRYGQG